MFKNRSLLQNIVSFIWLFWERTRDTGWRRLIGSPKLQIIFHKRGTKYWSLLRKMTYKDEGSYEFRHPVHVFWERIQNKCLRFKNRSLLQNIVSFIGLFWDMIHVFWERIQNKDLICGNGYRVAKTHGMP